MKKTIKLAVVAALALGTTSAFATNGDVMIGQGAKARSMGGTGIAKSFGAESALVNPANISSVKDMEATLAITYFAPDVKLGSNARANINNAFGANGYRGPTTPPAPGSAFATDDPTKAVASPSSAVVTGDSGSGSSIIPEIYFAAKLTDKLAMGIAVAGTAGMGTDYTNETTNGSFGMMTALSLLKVAVPVSYNINGGLTLGAAAVMQYGSLEMKHDTMPSGTRANGASTDIGYGYEVGLNYTNSGLTLGAVYKSAIAMSYENTIGASLADFGVSGAITSGDSLEQPEERGIGIAYAMGANTLTADYKNIAWGDAKGYSDFGWENQDVYALGYEYAGKSWAFRAGYNYAKSPIVEQDGSKTGSPTSAPGGNYVGAVKNFFNMAGFPGIVETHYTIGGGYDITEAFTLDGSFIYVPEASASFDTSGLTEGATYQLTSLGGLSQNTAGAIAAGTSSSTADVTHSQMALTIGATYRF